MTDFATAGADLDGELSDIRASMERLSSRLGNALDALTARVAALEAQARPKPTPLVSGPPWPSTAVLRGSAPLQHSGGTTTVRLRPRTVDTAASSDTHELHQLLTARLPRYTWSVDLALDTAMLDAITWKFGGMASFDGDWARWPGGSTSGNTGGTTNAMERLVGANTTSARRPIDARYGVYCTFPTTVAEIPAGKDGISATVGGARAWVTNGGHTCHWEIDALAPIPGRTDHHERQVDMPAGTLRHLINGDEVLSLTGLPWLSPGMNRVYISSMIGGNGPEFLPRTTDRTGTLTYSRFELSPG